MTIEVLVTQTALFAFLVCAIIPWDILRVTGNLTLLWLGIGFSAGNWGELQYAFGSWNSFLSCSLITFGYFAMLGGAAFVAGFIGYGIRIGTAKIVRSLKK